jgi:hypothetical protein
LNLAGKSSIFISRFVGVATSSSIFIDGGEICLMGGGDIGRTECYGIHRVQF